MSLVQFDPEMYYFINLIQRRKDIPGLSRPEKKVDTFYVHTAEKFEKVWPHIVEKCESTGARAYINLNRRSWERTHLNMLKLIADNLSAGQLTSGPGLWDRAAGISSAQKPKLWVLDCDREHAEHLDTICDIVISIKNGQVIGRVPTLNGTHLITHGFDTRSLRAQLTAHGIAPIEVHDDGPTLLYCP